MRASIRSEAQKIVDKDTVKVILRSECLTCLLIFAVRLPDRQSLV